MLHQKSVTQTINMSKCRWPLCAAFRSVRGSGESVRSGGLFALLTFVQLGDGGSEYCVNCARAVESTWRGSPVMSAAMAKESAGGTAATRITEWSGGSFQRSTYRDIEDNLRRLGANSSVIIVSSWANGRGSHAYNAANDGGVVKFIDGQSGIVSVWPPIPWTESHISTIWAVFFDSEGNPV